MFEQDRESVLAQQIEELLAEREGAAMDARLFAQMTADEARLVESALGLVDARSGEEWSDLEEDDDDPTPADGESEDDADEFEAELARLQTEIAASHQVQAALRRYLELLAE